MSNYFHYERQWPLVGYNDLVPTDFGDGAFKALALQKGTTVLRLQLVVSEAFAAGTVAVGDLEDPDRYGTGLALTAGIQDLEVTGAIAGAATSLIVTATGVNAAATAGRVRVIATTMAERKADEIQE